MARVLVLYTGGTIGMVPVDGGDPSSPLVPAGRERLEEHLRAHVAHPDEVDYVVAELTDDDGRPLPPIDSTDITAAHWTRMARAVVAVHDEVDGVVVLHGTDTMAWSASALSFLLEGLAKPVVLTGSQRPIAAPGTDAVGNVAAALRLAGAVGVPVVPEVVVAVGAAVLRGNRARKTSSSALDAFTSPNHPGLGTIGADGSVAITEARPAPAAGTPLGAPLDLAEEVVDVTLFPGMRPDRLGALLFDDAVRGAIVRTYGAGNAPAPLRDVIGEAVAAGTVVVSVTQCPHGAVDAGLYLTGAALHERGVVPGRDLTPEAALTKLMWLLGQLPPEEAATQVPVDLRGELTPPAPPVV